MRKYYFLILLFSLVFNVSAHAAAKAQCSAIDSMQFHCCEGMFANTSSFWVQHGLAGDKTCPESGDPATDCEAGNRATHEAGSYRTLNEACEALTGLADVSILEDSNDTVTDMADKADMENTEQ